VDKFKDYIDSKLLKYKDLTDNKWLNIGIKLTV